ncbi:hypothetical protein D5S18_22570 [Nocardia panacis]|uniref:Alpha/beta hydrolase n=1 Tax=Nocardia panacis TaxID=2340916 RepID=A0A3A4KI59_9NOCA|nr:hypothetical protein [Nocardia panacis]RJO72555.1 hypothetical protein D5S18_22570 [Nocardia panacis]
MDVFLASRVSTLIVHGDRDGAVSYPIAAEAAVDSVAYGCRVRFVGAEDEAIMVTVDWLVDQAGAAS